MSDNRKSAIGEEITKSKETQTIAKDINKEKVDKLKSGLFLTFVTAVGLISGFGFSLSSTKKRETKNLSGEKLTSFYTLHDSGVDLARKALARATLYSVTGFSLVCITVWKLSGASNFQEFRAKVHIH